MVQVEADLRYESATFDAVEDSPHYPNPVLLEGHIEGLHQG